MAAHELHSGGAAPRGVLVITPSARYHTRVGQIPARGPGANGAIEMLAQRRMMLLNAHRGLPYGSCDARSRVAAYRSGNREDAMSKFPSVVSGLDWETCRTVIEKQVPGGVLQAMSDVDNFFGSYLVAIDQWKFGPKEAATISQPALSVLGTESEQWFVEGHELLHTWFPRIGGCRIESVGHLLHMQRPERVLSNVAEWLARHPMASC